MRKMNWEEVQDAGEYKAMPAGAYVIKVTDAVDHEREEYVDIIFDVVEGEYAGIYKDTPINEDWKHSFRRYYSDKAMPFFKGMLTEFERDNPSFTIARWQEQSNPKDFIGLQMGALFGERRYLNRDGEAKYNVRFDRPLSVDAVRSGKFEIPDIFYDGVSPQEWQLLRDGETISSTTDKFDESIPF